MKETMIRFRVSEDEKKHIEMLAEASPYTKGVSEYILDLIREDAGHYHAINVEAVVYGPNKTKTETVEKRRISLGDILIDGEGRGTNKQFFRLVKEAEKEIGDTAGKSGHYIKIVANRRMIEPPAPMATFVRFE